MKHQILKTLVVEDDPIARTALTRYLSEQGCYAVPVNNTREAMTVLSQESFDVVFIDLYLPGEDGHALCKKLRNMTDIGIIYTSSCEDSVERIVALESGADTYYTKPLPMREVYAYTKNLVQRLKSKREVSGGIQSLTFNSWHFFPEEQSISDTDGHRVNLTKNETRILEFMVEHAEQPLKREQLGHSIGRSSWNADDRSVDVLVGKLRNKIASISGNNHQIKTQYGVGYIFTPER